MEQSQLSATNLPAGETDDKQIHNTVSSKCSEEKHKKRDNGGEREGVSNPVLLDGRCQRCCVI